MVWSYDKVVDHGATAREALWSPLVNCIDKASDAPAIFEPRLGCFRFGQLGQMFAELTSVLEAAGLGPQDSVAVVQREGACALISLLGAARFCASCPVAPSLTAEELEQDLSQLGASAVIVDDRTDTVGAVAARLGLAVIEATAEIPRCTWKLVRNMEERVASQGNGDAVLLLHTSATTGHRKLVPLTHANVKAMLKSTLSVTMLTETDRLLLMARHFHIQGTLSVLAQLSAGGSVIAPRLLTAAALHETLHEFEPTWYTCGPTMHRALLMEIRQSGRALPRSLRFVRSAGAPLPASLFADLAATLHVPVLNVYGLSETGGVTSTGLEELTPHGSVGRGMGPEIAVMREDGSMHGCNEEGEIVVRGPAVMRGYLHNEAANREAFYGSWFRTGDLGRIDVSGYLFLSGRIKEIINRGGEKIIPDEIDAVLSQHPSVREVAAFGVPHPTLGEEVACTIVLRDGATTKQEELRSFARKHLAAFKVPKHISLSQNIPRGSTGKPQRLLLRKEFLERAERTDQSQARDADPSFEEKGQVLSVWSSLLGCETIGLEDDFFMLGGDSLAAVTMLAGMDTLFGLETPLSAERFMNKPTVTGVLEMLVQAEDEQECAEDLGIIHSMRKNGPLGTIFMVPANETKGLYLRRMARHMTENWSSSLLRPAECGPYHPMYAIEDAAQAAVRALRKVQPEGPYILGGYCQGGVIAFEAGILLERLGETVLLILLDTPFPGGINPLRQWDVYSTNVRDKLATAGRSLTLRPIFRSALSLSRKVVWLIIRKARPLFHRLWRFRVTRHLCAWSTYRNFSFYRAGLGTMPILHILGRDETSRMLAGSRLRWADRTTERVLYYESPGDHYSLFHEANLPMICQVIENWLSIQLPLQQVKPEELQDTQVCS